MLYFLSGCSNGRLELAGNDCFTSSGNILNQIIQSKELKGHKMEEKTGFLCNEWKSSRVFESVATAAN